MNYLLNGVNSARLSFRSIEGITFEEWLPFFDNPNNPRMVGLDSLPSREEQCAMWFERSRQRIKDGLGGMNALYETESGLFVGQCGLLVQEVNGQRELEVGYSLLPAFWGKGYAIEAASCARDIAFGQNHTDSLISIIHIDNVSSQKVARKNGMTPGAQVTYKEMPVNVFRISREEWVNR